MENLRNAFFIEGGVMELVECVGIEEASRSTVTMQEPLPPILLSVNPTASAFVSPCGRETRACCLAVTLRAVS